MYLTFWGGAGKVTGANYILETSEQKIMIDCGLHQGSDYCDECNFKPFPYNPKEIEAVFITHAHIDHIGRLPKLYKEGFRGKIFSTPPTKDFALNLLLDSQHILNKEAEAKKKPPLYDTQDVKKLMELWEGTPYHQNIKIKGGNVKFCDAGHILGSSFINITVDQKKIIFSGDLGNNAAPLIKDTESIDSANYVIIESTYGNRLHEDINKRKDILEDIIEETISRQGTLLIPAFAMERTQDLLFELNNLIENHHIPRVPVFIDSPLAIQLTEIYKKYANDPNYFDQESINNLKKGDKFFDFPGLTMTLTTEESKKINTVKPPKIIIAGAGMSQGGRIIHHERLYLSDPKNTILFIGYQAHGSLGRQILDGAKIVKILGEEIPVKCQVKSISGYSAHADQLKLINWLRPARFNLKKVFVVQGEQEGSSALANKIIDELAVEAIIPREGDKFML
jgi:metallo-beta-lactamase family protein